MNSKKTLLFIAFFNLVSLFFFHNWNDYPLQNGDSLGYYNFLPAFFIHHDLIDAETRQTAFARHKNHTDHINEPNFKAEDMPPHYLCGSIYKERRVNYYTCGVAMLQTPFFLTAHVLAQPLGFKADGFSLPYRFAIALSGCFYTLLGLLFLMFILRGPFDETTTSISLLIVGLATNLYYFSTYNPFMSHNHLFTLVAILMWSTIQFYKTFEWKYLFLMAFFSGFITITRQTDAIFLVIPVFYQVYSWQTLRSRLQLVGKMKWAFLMAIFCFILPMLPQFFYWKLQTGNWIFNNYGELLRFDFKNPKIIKGLFYFGNGWLAYTPVMALAVLGVAFLFKKRDFLVPILLFFPIYVFVIYSWWCWNYINGFGSRPMIDAYALLAIPLSVSVDFIRKLPIWGRIPLFSLIFSFGLLNIWQTQQVNLNIMMSEDGSLAYVWNILPKTKLDYDALIAFDSHVFQPSNPTFLKKIYENNFEDSITSPNAIVREKAANGLVSYKVLPNTFSAGYKGKIADFDGATWMRVSVKAFSPANNIFEIYQKSILVAEVKHGDKSLEWAGVKLENKLGESDKIIGGKTGVWGEVSFFIKIPKDALPTDDVGAFIWQVNTYPIIIDDLKVEAYK
jgi:hypothetical protein